MSRITIIAFGTRGDAQPAVAVGRALQAGGHRVRLLVGANFASWVAGFGLETAVATVDIQAMMESAGGQEWVERGSNPLAQARIMKRLFDETGWQMIADAWEASRDADLLMSSFTSDAYAVSIAEKRGIPQVSMLPQPALFATRNGRCIPNAPLPNRTSRVNALFSKLFIESYSWQMVGKMTNRFRQEVLGLPPQSRAQNTAARKRMLTLLGYSPHVVPHPDDWPAGCHTTGYWFLDTAAIWEPPTGLQAFLDAGPPPVCIGFGSMTGRDPRAMTDVLVQAVAAAGTRAVLLSGWAGLGGMTLPGSVWTLDAAPHDWLFPRVAAVVHHGGAGTTAAGLRAGVPNVIVPHFADQPYWGQRLHALGVGPAPIPRPKLTVERLAAALRTAVTDAEMRQRAAALGEQIRSEDGVATAVALVNRALAASSAGT